MPPEVPPSAVPSPPGSRARRPGRENRSGGPPVTGCQFPAAARSRLARSSGFAAAAGLILTAAGLVMASGCRPVATADTEAATPAPASAPAAPPPPPAAAAAATPPLPFDVVTIGGTPEAIGRDHGRRLGARIRMLEERYVRAIFSDASRHAAGLVAAAGFRPLLRPHHRAELDALAEAAGVPAGRMLLANSFLDLLPSVGCATIALPGAASADGVPRFGRNLDFPSLDVAADQSLVVVVRPEGRHAFAAVTWPGLVGVLSGMNEHGLTLANMEVKRTPRVPAAMPYAFLYRAILEECRTVDQAIALLEREGRQTANNLMLMDAAGDRALVEIAPQAIRVRRAKNQAPLVATNHHREDGGEPDVCTRYDCLSADAARDWGRLDRTTLENLLARTSQGDLTLQSMIFEPADRRLLLAVGKRAAGRGFHLLDLGPLLAPVSRESGS